MINLRGLAQQARDRAASTWNEIADDFNARQRAQVRSAAPPLATNNAASNPQQQRPLDQFQSVTLDGSGNGITSLGPQIVREHWQPSAVAVSVTTDNNEAQCSLYLGSTVQSSNLLAQTATGSSGDTCGIPGNVDMVPGMLLWAKWTGGDPGAQATMHVMGTRQIGSDYL